MLLLRAPKTKEPPLLCLQPPLLALGTQGSVAWGLTEGVASDKAPPGASLTHPAHLPPTLTQGKVLWSPDALPAQPRPLLGLRPTWPPLEPWPGCPACWVQSPTPP